MAASKKLYVVYHVASTMSEAVYKSEYAAKKLAAKKSEAEAKWLKKEGGAPAYSVAEMSVYKSSVVYMVEKVNMMSGLKYWEASNTPSYCSPASEAYWSM
jgi:hypothetical protein